MISHRQIFCALAIALLPVSAVASDDEKPGVVAVAGEGSAFLAPDMAVISLTVLREDESARVALDANNDAMAEVLAAMKTDGIEDRDLQTSGFSIVPQYDHSVKRTVLGGPEVIGYRVMNTLTVRVRDLDKVGALIDKSVSLGVNQGGQIVFTNDDPSEAISNARTAAMIDARAKATTLVEAVGVSLGRITQINEQTFRPQPLPMVRQEYARASLDQAAVPIAQGENEYRVSVNVSFEIEQ